MRPPTESRATGRSVQVLLAALLLWAAVVRVWTALPNPTHTRYWDERFGVQNVTRVLRTGSPAPANGFHPTLSYLPQALVLGAAQSLHERFGWPAGVLAGTKGLNPRGYLLCRFTQVAFGLAGIWLLFLLGRRLFDPTIGLFAAFLFAAVPWHLRQSVIFKPDVLLLLTGILALLASVMAVERPSARRFAVAGAAIGLALASKFNAAPFAVPLAIGALWRAREGWLGDRHAASGRPKAAHEDAAWRSSRRPMVLLWLVLAAAVSVAVLLLLDPWLVLTPDLYRGHFGRTLEDYEVKGESAGLKAWELPVHAAATLLRPTFHGPWLGLLALVALVASLVPRLNRGWPPGRRRGWAMLAGFVTAYVGLYSLVTRNPSPHNWLVLVPVTSLAAAWAVVEIARRAARQWPALTRCTPAAAVLFVAAASWPLHDWAYRESVPTTTAIAEEELLEALQPAAGRLVLTEAPLKPSLLGPARQGSMKRRARALPRVVQVPHLLARPAAELASADALVFPAERLRDPASGYAGLTAGEGRSVLRISAAPLRRRGADLVIVLRAPHPRPLSHPPSRSTGRGE